MQALCTQQTADRLKRKRSAVFAFFRRGAGLQLPAFGLLAAAHKGGVDAGLADQLLMGALLDDAAVVHDQDLVGLLDGGQTVGKRSTSRRRSPSRML